VSEGDIDADQDVDEAEEAESAADHGARSLTPLPTTGRVVCAVEDRLGKLGEIRR
jgi:hypothetical protein